MSFIPSGSVEWLDGGKARAGMGALPVSIKLVTEKDVPFSVSFKDDGGIKSREWVKRENARRIENSRRTYKYTPGPSLPVPTFPFAQLQAQADVQRKLQELKSGFIPVTFPVSGLQPPPYGFKPVGGLWGNYEGRGMGSHFKGMGDTGDRMQEFQGALANAKRKLDSGIKFLVPKGKQNIEALSSSTRQIGSVLSAAEGTSSGDVADALINVLDALDSAAVVVEPILDILDNFDTQLKIYKYGESDINPWDTQAPALVALNACNTLLDSLQKANEDSTTPLRILQSSLNKATGIIRADSGQRAAILRQAEDQRIQQAKDRYNNAVAQANQLSSAGDFDGAFAVLNDPAVISAAADAGLSYQLQTTLNNISKRKSAGGQPQGDAFSQLFSYLMQQQQAKKEKASQAEQQRQQVIQQIQGYAYSNPQYYQYLISLPQYAGLFSAPVAGERDNRRLTIFASDEAV